MKIKAILEGRFEADADQLKRIKSVHDEYHKKYKGDPHRLAGMIVNTNQSLTNYALVQAWKKLKIVDFDPKNKDEKRTETYKRAVKYADKKGLSI